VFTSDGAHSETLGQSAEPVAPDPAPAQAIQAQALATAIPVNTVQIKGQTIAGAGTEADPWGP